MKTVVLEAGSLVRGSSTAPALAEHHPEHFTDRAARQAVDRRAQRRPVERGPMSHSGSCLRLTGDARYACLMTSS